MRAGRFSDIRRLSRASARVAVTLVMALIVLALPLTAQSSGGVQPPPPPPPADTAMVRHSPFVYFFRSALIPGWGQASLDRKLTAGLFIAFEGLAWSMTLKSNTELSYLDKVDSTTALSRRAERQDWIVLIVFNHLFSALEAYVSAHLFDFPADLHARALPGGRTGIGVTFGMPHH